MQKLLKKIFTSNALFTVAMAFVVVFLCASAFVMDLKSESILCFITAAGAFFLYFSYRKHDKNLMKGLLGAQLMALTIIAVKFVDFTGNTADTVFTWVIVVFQILLMANHFVINSSRYANPTNIFINQLLCLIVGAVGLAWNICCISWNAGSSVLWDYTSYIYYVYYVLSALNTFFEIYMVVYIESKLDNYRLKREANGWTIEGGYAENYDRTENYGK